MSCFQTLSDYGLRSLGYGERLLPKADITLCEQFVLIGSGMIWNIYFAFFALLFGFFFAITLALGKNSNFWLWFYWQPHVICSEKIKISSIHN